MSREILTFAHEGCVDCPVGRSSNAGVSGPITLGCEACAARYQEMMIDCVDCPTGYATDTLASACDACPLGHFALTPGGHAKPCACAHRKVRGRSCPWKLQDVSTRGYIASNASSACKTCPGGRFLNDSDVLQRMTALETAPRHVPEKPYSSRVVLWRPALGSVRHS